MVFGLLAFSVVLNSADETGTEEAFEGALLNAQKAASQIPEEQGFRPDSSSTSDSPIPDERAPDTWRQPLAPQQLYPETARGSGEVYGCKQAAVAASSMNLHTIWARLLTQLREDTPHGHESSAASAVAGGAAAAPVASSFFKQTSGLASAQVAVQVLQAPRSGTCCFCRTMWTASQRRRALAVETLLEVVFNSLDNPESELRDGSDHSPANSLSSVAGCSDRQSHEGCTNSIDSGEKCVMDAARKHNSMNACIVLSKQAVCVSCENF